MDENNTNFENSSPENNSESKSPSSYEAPTESDFKKNTEDNVTPAENRPVSAFSMPENNNTQYGTSHQEVFGGKVEGTANNYYTNPNAGYSAEPEQISNGFAIASLVMGILCILTCCCGPLSVIFGILGIIFFCVQPKDFEGKRPTMATVGLILSIVGIVIAISLIAASILLNSGDFYRQIIQDAV